MNIIIIIIIQSESVTLLDYHELNLNYTIFYTYYVQMVE